jgi:uncharacterized membrane protein
VRDGARRSLIICYTLELLALGTWIGGLVVIIASVIPSVFNSLGMETGGRFLTRVFDGYNRATVAAILVLVGCSAARVRADRVGQWSGAAVTRTESALLTVMIAIAALIILVLGPHSVTLQEQAFATKNEAAKKLAYDAFFHTHTVVRGLYVLNLGLGIALLTVKVRGWTGMGK